MSTEVLGVGSGRANGTIRDTPVLSRVSAAYPGLTPTERKVADALLADPFAFTRMPMKRMEEMAGVSAPSVMRFCRAIGYKGLTELKLALTGSLAASEAISSGMGDPRRLLDSSENMIGQLRQLPSSADLSQAVLILKAATHIGCFASHELGMAATYAREVFLRHGLAATIAASGIACSPACAAGDRCVEGTVALCFCNGMPDSVLFDRLKHYRSHGSAIVILSDVPLPAFVPQTVNLVLGGSRAQEGAAALFAHCLATDILLAELVALPPHVRYKPTSSVRTGL